MKKLFVVGLGPGSADTMTAQARAALAESDVLCGYTVYTDLVAPLYPDKPVLTTPMRKEIDRCRMALERAAGGETVAMVCSGDAGVYGMACLIYQLASGLTDLIYPVSNIVIVCGLSDIKYGTWLKWVMPLVGILFVVEMILVSVFLMIGL